MNSSTALLAELNSAVVDDWSIYPVPTEAPKRILYVVATAAFAVSIKSIMTGATSPAVSGGVEQAHRALAVASLNSAITPLLPPVAPNIHENLMRIAEVA